MKIYTKTGDKGMTSLLYGERAPKNDPRVEAYGTCDEANSMIGLACTYIKDNEVLQILSKVQFTLFQVGAQLATPHGRQLKWQIEEKEIEYMENIIDKLESKLPVLSSFIVPGGGAGGATLHVARTIVRRAERLAVSIENAHANALIYLNRLSDLLFVLARYVNYKEKNVEKAVKFENA